MYVYCYQPSFVLHPHVHQPASFNPWANWKPPAPHAFNSSTDPHIEMIERFVNCTTNSGSANGGNCSFIGGVLQNARTQPSSDTSFVALLLINRVMERKCAPYPCPPMHLWVVALMISWKMFNDEQLSQEYWCHIGKSILTPRELAKMEREMCVGLKWEFMIDPGVLNGFKTHVKDTFLGTNYSSHMPYVIPSTINSVQIRNKGPTAAWKFA
ncbi:hypothetical protein H0H81_008700 [Sphagnurus paluster]|uniref:Cyclin N-terminal domain-containing protein n=1 Tax=Sphagnurus paluster TaxID=117069 RepID=A0A9P7FXE0_9AGAR|nr:hypothetical protein H0H81_008700 [Sphagnurus paluster]